MWFVKGTSQDDETATLQFRRRFLVKTSLRRRSFVAKASLRRRPATSYRDVTLRRIYDGVATSQIRCVPTGLRQTFFFGLVPLIDTNIW